MKAAIDLLVYGGLLLLEFLTRCIPPRLATQIADGAGRFWYAVDGRRRRRAFESLKVAERGGLEVKDREALVRRTFQTLMHIPIEVMAFPRYFRNPRDVIRRCQFFGDWEAFREDLEKGEGGLFVSGHLGSWELAAWALRWLDVPSKVVARPIENPWVEKHTIESRGGDDHVIYKHGAIHEVLRTLRAKGWVGIMADQNAGPRGTFVPFFGLPASTYATPAVVAVRTGVPVYAAGSLRRREPPFTFEIHLRRLPDPPADAPESEQVEHYLRHFMKALEQWIHMAPDQYNWVHRRWKTRPRGAIEGPDLPRYDRRSRPIATVRP